MNNLDSIDRRNQLYSSIRAYFHKRGIREVEVPSLGKGTATDPHLASIPLLVDGNNCYLQTSPELFMKRLLARGSGSIFTICKAFRDGEIGPRHNPEFSMLEWYVVDFDLEGIIQHTLGLLSAVSAFEYSGTHSYEQLYREEFSLNPHTADTTVIESLVQNHTSYSGQPLDRSSMLDLLFSEKIESKLAKGLVVVTHYPSCQAAMAKLQPVQNEGGETYQVAERFEVFLNGIELANGYHELTDGKEQRERCLTDLSERRSANLPTVDMDQQFLAALDQGIPSCSGVALGLDRLLAGIQQNEEGRLACASAQMLFKWSDL